MEGFDNTIFVWAADDEGHKRFCRADCLRDLSMVEEDELGCCLAFDPRDEAREGVTLTEPSGRIKYSKFVSLD